MDFQTLIFKMKIIEKDRKENAVAVWNFQNKDYSCSAKKFIDWLSNLNESNIKNIEFKGFNFEFKICEEQAGFYAYYFNCNKMNYKYRAISNGKIEAKYILEDMTTLKNKLLLRYNLIGRNSYTVFNQYDESSVFKFKYQSGDKDFASLSYENWGVDSHIGILDFFISYYKDKYGNYKFEIESEPGYDFLRVNGLKIENKKLYYFSQILEHTVEDGGISSLIIAENHEYLLLGSPEQIAIELCVDMEREKEKWVNFSEEYGGANKFLLKLNELQKLAKDN